MPVHRDADGRRWVAAEVEVPGTPEEVWRAIATGPGVSAWFVPTEIEERPGGAIRSSFGPGMDALATVTQWDPPRRFVAEGKDDPVPDDPTIATEWTVEARAGGTCLVRVVHSWFSDRDAWDAQFEGHSHGWVAFFRILHLYLTRFAGQASASFQAMGADDGPSEVTWRRLLDGLGLGAPRVGHRVDAAAGGPPLGGEVTWVGPPDHPELLLRLDAPGPGIAHLFPLAMGEQVYVSVRGYFYGPDAPAAVGLAEPAWRRWLGERFPMPE